MLKCSACLMDSLRDQLGRVSCWRRRARGHKTRTSDFFIVFCLFGPEKAHTYTNNNNMERRPATLTPRVELADLALDRIRSEEYRSACGLDSLPAACPCCLRCCCCCISYWIPFTTWIFFLCCCCYDQERNGCAQLALALAHFRSLSLFLCLSLCSCNCVCALLQYHLAIDSLLRIAERCTRS